MLDFLGRISAYWAGLPSLYLLLFVLVIWVVFALILLADARNKLNQWCFIGGMAFSVGVFKEYLYYGIGRRSSYPRRMDSFRLLKQRIPF